VRPVQALVVHQRLEKRIVGLGHAAPRGEQHAAGAGSGGQRKRPVVAATECLPLGDVPLRLRVMSRADERLEPVRQKEVDARLDVADRAERVDRRLQPLQRSGVIAE
jgi:hypothetical protein